MNSGNPTLQPAAFKDLAAAPSGAQMTLTGTVAKSAILLMLVIFGSTFSWGLATTPTGGILTWGGMVAGLVVALVTIFKKTWAPITSPIYALFQGLFLGGISAMYNAQSEGIVLQAIMLTFGTLAGMLFLYQTGIIKVTDKFRTVVVSATVGILLFYVVSLVLNLFGVGVPLLHGTGMLSIGISLFIVGIAALNLALDFDLIDNGIASGAPRYMEWYCAFGLMVTLIWLYLEILRLLAKLRR